MQKLTIRQIMFITHLMSNYTLYDDQTFTEPYVSHVGESNSVQLT